MGNYNFKPRASLGKNQPVEVVNFKFSDEHTPKEVKTLGNGHAIHTIKLHQSRPNAQPVYVTRVKTRSGKYETFLTNSLKPS